MLKRFTLRSFRLLTLGGAKASTNGDIDLPDVEFGDTRYEQP